MTSFPLRGHFVNLWQSLRPMPLVNGAHVVKSKVTSLSLSF